MRDACANHISLIRSLLGMYGYQIVDRCVGGNDNRIGSYNAPARCLDTRLLSSLDFRRMSLGVDTTASRFYRLSQPGQVFEWMKLSLHWKAQCCSGVVGFPRNSLHSFNFAQSCSVHSFQLVLENVFRVARGHKKITIKPFEFTFDRFLFDDCFNLVNSCRVTLSSEARPLFAV